MPEIEETDDIINLFGQVQEIERQTWKAAEALAAFAAAVKALQPMFEALAQTLRPLLITLGDVIEKAINIYPNKRVIYLAKYGKGRTKKKNINRITTWVKKQGKTPSAKRSSRGYIKYIERDGHKYAVFAQN